MRLVCSFVTFSLRAPFVMRMSRLHALAKCGEAGLVGVQVSCDAYRDVVRKDPRFIDFFSQSTPVSELGRMNIGSRPAKRKAAVSLDGLRAIPWIFAWTQTRFHLPVWLGVGEAFQVRQHSGCASQRDCCFTCVNTWHWQCVLHCLQLVLNLTAAADWC